MSSIAWCVMTKSVWDSDWPYHNRAVNGIDVVRLHISSIRKASIDLYDSSPSSGWGFDALPLFYRTLTKIPDVGLYED